LATSKPTIIADPYGGVSYSVQNEVVKILKQRYASVGEAEGAKVFGILVSLKPGQKHMDEALRIKESVEKMGKTAYMFAVREILPDILAEFPSVDAYVNTACPRISLDDASKFKKPVLTVQEFMIISGESSWENLLRKGLFEN
jgi:2-(3-amino-3-carboxypropyl)histidine synthase